MTEHGKEILLYGSGAIVAGIIVLWMLQRSQKNAALSNYQTAIAGPVSQNIAANVVPANTTAFGAYFGSEDYGSSDFAGMGAILGGDGYGDLGQPVSDYGQPLVTPQPPPVIPATPNYLVLPPTRDCKCCPKGLIGMPPPLLQPEGNSGLRSEYGFWS